MKIVVVGTRGFPEIQGGVESHCEQLYTHLSEKGCDITVFSRKPYVKSDMQSYKGISLIPIDCPRNKFLEAIVHTFRAVLAARKLKPDILHVHAIGPSLFIPLAKLIRMKVVMTHHGPDYKRKKWPIPAKIFLKICERMGVMYADKVIAIAGNIAFDIKQQYGKGSIVIPNGVNIPSLAGSEVTLKQYGLQKGRYILAVGRFVPEKGFDDLIDAFNQGNLEKWKLVIVGDADHEDNYSRNLKSKAKENSNIILTGFLKGLPLHELYSHAGLFVLPSYYEGLPIVLLEAMSYGISCIASDIPANRNVELSEDRFVQPGNTGLLNSKMRDYQKKSWEAEDKKRQISIIHEKYNWKKIADETLKVYQSTCA